MSCLVVASLNKLVRCVHRPHESGMLFGAPVGRLASAEHGPASSGHACRPMHDGAPRCPKHAGERMPALVATLVYMGRVARALRKCVCGERGYMASR